MATGIISTCGFAAEMCIATVMCQTSDTQSFLWPIPRASIVGSTFSIAILTIGFTEHCPAQVEPISGRNRSAQNSSYGGPADRQEAGDFGLADSGTVQFLDFGGVYGRGCRPAQSFPVLPR